MKKRNPHRIYTQNRILSRPGGWILILLTLALPWLAGCAQEEPPSIVLIVIDTLRKDHLECYGFEKATSPCISKFAQEGVIFDRALAASPWTGPSVASIVTGTYPDELGMRDLLAPLPDTASTLAEKLKKAGYATYAVVSNGIAGPAYGHDQGYDDFFFKRYKEKKENLETAGSPLVFTADRVTDKALEMMAAASKPFFLYVHYTDPHDPYLPPSDWKERFLKGYSPLDEKILKDSLFTEMGMEPGQVETLKAHYQAEIAFTDHEVSRVLEALGPDTLVVLTGDHGEEFLEHGGFLHGHTLYRELLDVPLIFRGPGLARNTRIDDPVSHVDIAPTILDLAGVDIDRDPFSGCSLKPRLTNAAAPLQERPLFSVLETDDYHCVSVAMGSWKLLLVPAEKTVCLFDLAQDPSETRNVAQENPEVVSALIQAVKQRKARIRSAAQASPDMIKAREEELRAIGYIK